MKNKNAFCISILYLYIIYLSIKYYTLYISSNAASSILVKTQDIDIFVNLLSSAYIQPLAFVSIKNIIYSFILAISNNGFFAYTWTSFSLYIICIFLVYKIANFQKSSEYTGLIAVLIFTTLPNMMLSVFGINVHISEGMCLLFVIFFYLKSHSFTNKLYASLYILFTFLSFLERASAPIQIAIILVITSLFCLKNKKYNFIGYNTIILATVLIFFLTTPHQSYFTAKINHWFIYFYLLDYLTILKLPFSTLSIFYKDLVYNLSLPYTILLLMAGALRITLFKKYNKACKNKTSVDFINLMLLLIFSLYIITIVPDTTATPIGSLYLDTAKFESIFTIFSFTAIIIANFFYLLKNTKYYNCLIILTIFAGASNITDFGIQNFKQQEKQFISQQIKYADTYKDISLELEFAITKKNIKNFLFVFEADLTPYTDIKKDVYEKLPKWVFKNTEKTLSKQHYELKMFMHHLNDIALLNGFTPIIMEYQEPIDLINYIDIPKKNIYNVLTCFTEQRPNAITIKHLKTWSFTLENEKVNLHMYSL